jgi:hypothetical protein
MRLGGKLLFITVLALAVSSLVSGQPPAGKGPGFAGKGKGKGNDYMSLLNNGSIKEELKLTDQQAEKLPAALQKALAEVLSDKQLQRLREIYLQQRGNSAYLESDVKKALSLSLEQSKKIQVALDSLAKAQDEMFQSGDFDFEKMQQLQTTTTETIQSLITKDQKVAWTKLVGQPFEMSGPGFGGGFGGGIGGKKDKDK